MKLLINAYGLLRRINALAKNPSDTTRVFAIVDYVIASSPPTKITRAEQILVGIPEFQRMRVRTAELDLTRLYSPAALESYPAGSLGRALGEYYREHEISPDFFTPRPERNSLWIMRNRLAQTHDIWHLLAGYGTTPEEEYALQAFYLGQEPSMTAYCIMLAGFLDILKHPSARRVKLLMDAVTRAYLRGQQTAPMLYVVWEDRFGESLAQVREELGLSSRAKDA